MTRPSTVLVVDGVPNGQSRSALAAVRAVAAAGHWVAVGQSGTRSLAGSSCSADVVVRLPAADHPSFSDQVLAVAAELGASTVLPASDAALLALGGPGASLVDKSILGQRVAAAGLPSLSSQSFASGAELAAAARDVVLPAVAKTARKVQPGSRPAAILRTLNDVHAWRDVVGPVVVEAFHDAPMTALFGIRWEGRSIALGAQRYLRTWPTTAGVACAAITCALPSPLDEHAISALLDGYEGIFQIQLVGPYVIDVNPRVYGSLPLAVRAGVNLPAIWCALQTGEQVARVDARLGVRYRWVEGDMRWAWDALRQRQIGASLAALVPKPRTAHSVWSLRDPSPLVARLCHVLRGSRNTSESDQAATVVPELGLRPREQHLVAAALSRQLGHHGIPDTTVVTGRLRARELIRDLLAQAPERAAILAPAWSTDIDVGPLSEEIVCGHRHLLPLDGLHARLGSRARNQWLVHDQGTGLSRLDVDAPVNPGPVAAIVARCQRNRRVTAREVLELRRLAQEGTDLPDHPVVAAAAAVEALLGGAVLEGVASRHAVRQRWLRHRPRRPHRRRRLVIAFSGLDGAGKSTQVSRLKSSLAAAGSTVEVVWTRPGMHLEWLRPLRRVVKRALGMSSEPGVRAVGRDPTAIPRSRKGVIGLLWRTLVMLSFAWSAWTPRLRSRGVLVYDRHILDALATMKAVYLAEAGPGFQWLVRGLLPPSDVTILLDVPAEVATSRKPDDVFNRTLLDSQQQVYRGHRHAVRNLVVLDGTQPVDDIAEQVLRAVLGNR